MTRNVKSLVFVYFGASDRKYILIGRTLVILSPAVSVYYDKHEAQDE